MTSGARYSKVPQRLLAKPEPLLFEAANVWYIFSLESPKSVILANPSRSMRIFSGFKLNKSFA
jgi:hypothetical protein